jgi:hypothetical protein
VTVPPVPFGSDVRTIPAKELAVIRRKRYLKTHRIKKERLEPLHPFLVTKSLQRKRMVVFRDNEREIDPLKPACTRSAGNGNAAGSL